VWVQPHKERTVLTKPKILTVPITLRVVERRHSAKRHYHVLSAADYQRLINAAR